MLRHYRGFVALLLIGILLSSCNLGDDAPESTIPATALPSADLPTEAPIDPDAARADAGEIVKISFGAQSFERAIYEPLIDAFNQQNPDVQVQFVSLDEIMQSDTGETFDFNRQLRRMVGAADTLSSFYVAPEAIGKGYFYDMRPLIDADTSFDPDDFYPGALDHYTRDGPLPQENIRSSGLFMSAQTQQPQACWEWLKFLSGELSDLAAQGSFPARRSLAEADAFLQQAASGAADVYKAYRGALDRAPASNSQAGSLYDSPIDLFWLFRAVDRALQGKDLDRQLEQAQALTEQYLACVRSGERAGICAKQIDPTYEGWRSTE